MKCMYIETIKNNFFFDLAKKSFQRCQRKKPHRLGLCKKLSDEYLKLEKM
jgi:hypothetical protein